MCEITLPPGQPGKPQVFERSYNSIHLKWDKPKYGAHIVQSYVFFYCSENKTDKWLSKATNKESVSLNGITPGIMYFFKVTAQSVTGSSPESEVGEIRLPQEPPGRPYAANITPNSIQLQWTKPSLGAEYIQQYIVWYQSVNGQWNSKSTDDVLESALLIDLVPNTIYCVKVQAVSRVLTRYYFIPFLTAVANPLLENGSHRKQLLLKHD